VINDNKKEKGVVLYHSGAGSTKFIAQLITEELSPFFDMEISHIKNEFNNEKLNRYSFVVFGFPTHHAEPSLSMLEYVSGLNKFSVSPKAFIFTSYGLYPGNSLRIFAKFLNKKNIRVLGSEEFKSPASDGVLLFPDKLKFMFNFEQNLYRKIKNFAKQVVSCKTSENNKLPPYKWYVPLNNLIKPLGEFTYGKYKKNISADTDLCIKCNKCIDNCERNAWINISEYPVFVVDKCEFCLECIHKCPVNAISFSENMKNKPRLNEKFFKTVKYEQL